MRKKSKIHLFSKVVDLDAHTISYRKDKRKVQPQLIRLLKVLFDNRGEVVTKEELLQEVWLDTIVTEDSLTKAISKLRKQLDPGLSKSAIITINGSGYVLRKNSISEKVRISLPVAILSLVVLFLLYFIFFSGLVQWATRFISTNG